MNMDGNVKKNCVNTLQASCVLAVDASYSGAFWQFLWPQRILSMGLFEIFLTSAHFTHAVSSRIVAHRSPAGQRLFQWPRRGKPRIRARELSGLSHHAVSLVVKSASGRTECVGTRWLDEQAHVYGSPFRSWTRPRDALSSGFRLHVSRKTSVLISSVRSSGTKEKLSAEHQFGV